MKAGLLDHKISLAAPGTNKNNYGEVVPDWTTYATVWARRVDKGTPRESVVGNQMYSQTVVEWYIHYSTDVDSIKAHHRVYHGATAYEVVGVQQIGRNEALKIITTLEKQ